MAKARVQRKQDHTPGVLEYTLPHLRERTRVPRSDDLADLFDFLRIQSISASPEFRGEIVQAAEFVAAQAEIAGLENVQVVRGAGNPLVCADWLHAPNKPTIVLYGHYDVQPPDPLDEWRSPPFEPSLVDGYLYARGVADDKAFTLALIKAVARLLLKHGALPVNVRLLVEGEEESGGDHFERFLSEERSKWRADAALVCDVEMYEDLPSVCVGFRGLVAGEVEVRGAAHDLHSGVYGGAGPNAVAALIRILSSLKDSNEQISIPGFYARVQPPSAAERESWKKLHFDENDFLTKELGAKGLSGEPEFSVLERLWCRPALEINGIRGGYAGEGFKSVIPSRALAKVSIRLVPDQVPEEAVRQFDAAIQTACPPYAIASFRATSTTPPLGLDPANIYVQKAIESLRRTFGKEPALVRSGGTVPAVGDMFRYLGIPSVVIGLRRADDSLHAPNERLDQAQYELAITFISEYLTMLGS